jgi:type IV pilus assembly protein PilY1
VFGGGYDTCEDVNDQISIGSTGKCGTSTKGQGIFVLDADKGPGTGGSVTYFDFGSTAGRIIADVVPVDVNFDGYTDVI